jgi:2-oxoisovalerate dehydrogenase E1 component
MRITESEKIDTRADEAFEQSLFEKAARIRAVENLLLDLHREGHFRGALHTCIGEETIAAALHPHLNPETDAFFATHRGHGHYLASGGGEAELVAEFLGRKGALCLGRGGSQHLQHRLFFANGIQGAACPQAVGYAWARMRADLAGISVVQLGDGTLGEGAVYEALTFAAVLKAPVLFLVQLNGWSQSTDAKTTSAGDLLERFRGFGLLVDRRSDVDALDLHNHFGRVLKAVRLGRPFVQIIDTRRLVAHSTHDDQRSRALLEELWREDTIESRRQAHPGFRSRTDRWRKELRSLADEILARPKLALGEGAATPDLAASPSARDLLAPQVGLEASVVAAINGGLHQLMADKRVLLIGEDLADPYGGAFKATRGLSTRYPDRVLSTPVAEAGIAGVAIGAALAGYRPVAEIMFGDFVTLAADQLINSAAKFHFTSGGKTICPITVRLPSGGGLGYGPTHSQSLERLFCGEPGLRVISLSRRHDPSTLIRHAVLDDDAPVVLVEPKPHYGELLLRCAPLGLEFEDLPGTPKSYPPLHFRPPRGARAAVTLIAYGHVIDVAEAAMQHLLIEHEFYCDYFVLTQLSPLDCDAILDSLAQTRRLLIVEPGVAEYGVGAAIIHQAALRGAPFSARTVGARALPIPSSHGIEESVLPSKADVICELSTLVGVTQC